MPGVFPNPSQGAIIVRDMAGVCTGIPGALNTYCPPESFQTTCSVTALPEDCTARILPGQINALVSEMLCLAATINPDGTWDCNSVCNLSEAFANWSQETNGHADEVTITGNGSTTNPFQVIPAGVIEAICADETLNAALAACVVTLAHMPPGVTENDLGEVPLLPSNNLSDVEDAQVSRDNLDVPGLSTPNTFTRTQCFAVGANVTAAATVALGDDGNYFNVDGSTQIDALSDMCVGAQVKLHFNDPVTLTHSANLVLPNDSNFAMGAGDEAEFVQYATGQWRMVSHLRHASTAAITGLFHDVSLALVGGNLVLRRSRGTALAINGQNEIVPVGGVSLPPSDPSVVPLTVQYIYAYMDAGVMKTLASATPYTIDPSTGLAIMTGDPTRALVGAAYATAGPVWQDSPNARFVRSWYNDNGVSLQASFSADRATASTAPVELNPEIRAQALMWQGEIFEAWEDGTVANNTSNGRNQTYIAFDGITASGPGNVVIDATTGNTNVQASHDFRFDLAAAGEGIHYATLAATVQTGTGTWYGAVVARRTTLSGKVHR